jgi:hypothetical protein
VIGCAGNIKCKKNKIYGYRGVGLSGYRSVEFSINTPPELVAQREISIKS